MLTLVYEIKDKLVMFFEAHGKQDFLLSIKLKKFHLILVNLVDIFEALNDYNLILQSKNINCINDCDAIDAFVAKLELGIVKFKNKYRSISETTYCSRKN